MIKLQYKNTAFYSPGMGIESETEMLDKGYDLKADLLKVGHHGSRYSTSEEFLNAYSLKQPLYRLQRIICMDIRLPKQLIG